MLLELAVAAIIVTGFSAAVVIHRDDRRLLLGDIAGVIAGLLFLAETLLAPESAGLMLVASVFVLTMLTVHWLDWRDRSPGQDNATTE